MVTEELPIAEEIEETSQSTLTSLVKSLMELPGVTAACAILDHLEEEGRRQDAEKFRSILRQFCAESKNGTYNTDYAWRIILSQIEALFWFDIHGMDHSLFTSFSGLGRAKHLMRGITMSSAPNMGTISFMHSNNVSAFTAFPRTNF